MKTRLPVEAIALRAAKEFQDGDCVNLGAGLPDYCTYFVPEGRQVFFHAENGVIGFGRILSEEEWKLADFDLVNAGPRLVAPKPGMCFTDHGTSFDLVRGGHINTTVLGALEVSEKGDLANWSMGDMAGAGIGGAMDMPIGPGKVIIIMEHTTKKGAPRIVKQCKFPLTAKERVNLIVTDLAVVEVTEDGLILKEIAPGWTPEEVQALTEPKLIVSEELKEMEL